MNENTTQEALVDDVDDVQEEVIVVDAEEEKAIKTGWTPKENFKGNPDMWKPADEWNKTAVEVLPILRATNKKLHATVSEIEAKNRAMKEQMDLIIRKTSEISEREYNKAKADIERAQRDAVANGDTDEFDRLKEQENKLKPPAQEIPQIHPAIATWQAKNSDWYGVDVEKTNYANFLASEYGRQGYTPEQMLREVDDQIGLKQEAQSRRTVQTVAKTTRKPSKTNIKKTYADLPPEGKQIVDELKREYPDYKEQDYVDSFFKEA